MEDESVAVISSVMGKMGEQGGEVWIDRGGPEEPIRGIKGLTKRFFTSFRMTGFRMKAFGMAALRRTVLIDSSLRSEWQASE